MSSIALAAATGVHFRREIFTGTYASDMGPWTPDAGRAIWSRDWLGRHDLAMFFKGSYTIVPRTHRIHFTGLWSGRCQRSSPCSSASPRRPDIAGRIQVRVLRVI